MTITRQWQTGWELNSFYSECDERLGVASNLSISSTSFKTGTYSLRIGGTEDYDASAVKNFTSTYQLRVGIHVRTPEMTAINNKVRVLTIQTAGGTDLLHMYVDGESNYVYFYVKNGTTAVGNLIPIMIDTYYHWGIDIKIDGSVGWCYIYKDGILVASFSGDTGTDQMERILFGSYPEFQNNDWKSGYYAYYDDITIDDTTGEGSAAIIPDHRYEFVIPNGDGNYSQMTGSDGNQINNYLLVDEIPPNDDTDFVRAGSTSLTDSYALADYTLPKNAEIKAVIPIAVSKKTSAEDIKLALGTRLSSTDLIGTSQVLPTSYALAKWERQTTKPGGGAWTESDVDSAEIVIESDGTYA
jgi:hypothetical protein